MKLAVNKSTLIKVTIHKVNFTRAEHFPFLPRAIKRISIDFLENSNTFFSSFKELSRISIKCLCNFSTFTMTIPVTELAFIVGSGVPDEPAESVELAEAELPLVKAAVLVKGRAVAAGALRHDVQLAQVPAVLQLDRLVRCIVAVVVFLEQMKTEIPSNFVDRPACTLGAQNGEVHFLWNSSLFIS